MSGRPEKQSQDQPTNNYNIYTYGVIAASGLHILSRPFPAADGSAEITRSYPSAGGEALNSSNVLSRLGLRLLPAGNWIRSEFRQ
jgi:hypothetical protein